MPAEDFWAKLQALRGEYWEPLHRLFPVIRGSPHNPDTMRNVQDCLLLLNLQRGARIPHQIDAGVLERFETYMRAVVDAYRASAPAHEPEADAADFDVELMARLRL